MIIILHSGKLTYKRQQRLQRRIAGVVPQWFLKQRPSKAYNVLRAVTIAIGSMVFNICSIYPLWYIWGNQVSKGVESIFRIQPCVMKFWWDMSFVRTVEIVPYRYDFSPGVLYSLAVSRKKEKRKKKFSNQFNWFWDGMRQKEIRASDAELQR